MGIPGLSTILQGLFSTPKGRDHLVTYAAEGTVLVGTVLAYNFAAHELGSAGFEIYAVVRRTVSFVIPLLMFGLAVALIRFGAMAATDEERWCFTWNAGLLVLVVGGLVVAITWTFKSLLGFIVFGDHAHDELVPDMGWMLPGLMMHSVVYGYWRGSHRMLPANVLQAFNLGVVPLVAFLLADDLAGVMRWMALTWSVTTVLPFVWLALRYRTASRIDRAALWQLLRYGTPRVPGDLAFGALLALPVFFINHVAGIQEGGRCAFGLTLLNMTGALFAPVSLLMLPAVARDLARGDHARVVRDTRRTRTLVVGLACIAVIIFQPLAGPLLRMYLGEGLSDLVLPSRVLFIGAVFYAAYISMRSVLDAYHEKARNSRNIIIALVLFLAAAAIYVFIWPETVFLLAMVPLALAVLAALTWRDTEAVLNDLSHPTNRPPDDQR